MDKQKERMTRREALKAGGELAVAGTIASLASSLPLQQSAKAASHSTTSDAQWQQVAAVFGVKGTIESGVLIIDLPRTDLHPSIFGVPVHPEIGFDTEITFQHIDKGAIVKYELVLLDSEVTPVLTALFVEDLQPETTTLNALHNHFLELSPEIKFLHGTTIGDPVQIARKLREALSRSRQPFVMVGPGNTGLPNKEIEQILGGTGMVEDSVLSVSVERSETIKELGIVLKPPMQVESMLNFQSIGNGQAAETAEIIVLPQEADAVARELREHGFFITALHNHELFISPNFYYLHAFATGPVLELARATRQALNKTNSKFM